MLRDNFDNVADSRRAHRLDHASLHRAYNHAIYVDDYDSIQASMNAATANGKNRVVFSPGQVYEITETIDVPAGVRICGGASFGIGGAEIRVMSALETAIRLNDQSSSTGIDLNGQYLAQTGYELNGRQNVLHDNRIQRIGTRNEFGGKGIYCKGILFPDFQRNFTQTIHGWAMYGLAEDGPAYYGINVGHSSMNSWSGTMGAIRLEGIMTFISDDFEMKAYDSVVSAGSISARIKMLSCYFECRKHDALDISAPIIKTHSAGRVIMDSCEVFGEGVESSRGEFVNMNAAYQLQVTASLVARFATFAGGYSANGARLVVRDCDINFVGEMMPDNWNTDRAEYIDLQWI